MFLLTTPKSVLAGQVQVGLLAGQAIFGPTGGKIVGALIGLGLIATISAMAWIGPRITKRMVEDLPKLQILGRSSANGTPYAAILFQIIIVTVLVATGTFETVLIYTQFSLLLSSFLTVLGLDRPAISGADTLNALIRSGAIRSLRSFSWQSLCG